MAGDWIQMRWNLDTDPRVIAIAATLGISVIHAIGGLWKVWSWADQHTIDGTFRCNAGGNARALQGALQGCGNGNAGGNARALQGALQGCGDGNAGGNARALQGALQGCGNGNTGVLLVDTIDKLTGVSGFCAAMKSVDWFAENEHGISFPDYEKYNGQTAKKRAKSAKRTQKHRNARALQGALQGGGAGNAGGNARASPEKRREEKRREEKKESNTACHMSPVIGSTDGIRDNAWERFLAAYPANNDGRKLGELPGRQRFEALPVEQLEPIMQAVANYARSKAVGSGYVRSIPRWLDEWTDWSGESEPTSDGLD